VCHGDIKLENILITSWNWVLLADFASFKPTYLPEDNPGDYSYFFDASRRRTCYIAPERLDFTSYFSIALCQFFIQMANFQVWKVHYNLHCFPV